MKLFFLKENGEQKKSIDIKGIKVVAIAIAEKQDTGHEFNDLETMRCDIYCTYNMLVHINELQFE